MAGRCGELFMRDGCEETEAKADHGQRYASVK
jgi:hypothetical protein